MSQEKIVALLSNPEIRAAVGHPSMVMKMMSDPTIMSALRDPHITKAYMEFSRDPAEFAKYQDDPKVADVAQRVL